MAIYRINPEKDTTIWSEPTVAGLYGNAGKDQILEIGGYPDINQTGRTKRALLQFNTAEMNSTLNTKVTGLFSASIHLYIADASEIPSNYYLYAYPLSSSWVNGTGRIDDDPVNRTGTSWKYKDAATTEWNTLGGDYLTGSYSGSQLHSLSSTHDVDIDVTEIITQTYSGSLVNNGLLVKIEDTYENYTSQSISLKYFGSDSATIFKPYLEFKWDDSDYSTTLDTLNTDIATISVKNKKEKYLDSEVARFRISARPKHPARTFSTSSIYLTEYALPEDSYWAIKDEFSGNMIVDFDSNYTKVSADNTSSYFDFYMNTLEPERYYRLLIKTTLAGSTTILDQNNIFKVVRNV